MLDFYNKRKYEKNKVKSLKSAHSKNSIIFN